MYADTTTARKTGTDLSGWAGNRQRVPTDDLPVYPFSAELTDTDGVEVTAIHSAAADLIGTQVRLRCHTPRLVKYLGASCKTLALLSP